jgi:large subunit ribosomal protein L1
VNVEKNLVKQALQSAIEESVHKAEGKKDKVRKFDESVDIIFNVRDVDLKNPNNRIEQEHILPHVVNEKPNLCFFAEGDMELAVKSRGIPVINVAALDELNRKPNKEKRAIARKYDYFVAREDLMRNVAKVMARFLGQRSKMPKPQPKGFGVIKANENLESYLDQMKYLIRIDMKKQLQIQTKLGHKSNDLKDLMENFESILGVLETKLPNGFQNIKSIFIKTTMGKPVKVQEPAAKKR